MIKAISIINKKNFYSGYNFFIYYLQKIPLIGKLIPNKLFNISGIDSLINIISFVFNTLFKLLSKTFFYGVILNFFIVETFYNILVDVFNITEKSGITKSNLYLYVLVSSTLIGITIFQMYFYENNLDAYIYIKQMKINPKDYYLGHFLYNAVIFIITFTPVNYIVLKLLGFKLSFIQILSFIIFAYSLRFLLAWIFLEFKILDEKKRDLISYTNLGLMAVLTIAMLLYVIFTEMIIDFIFLFDVKFLIFGLFIFLFSLFFILRNKSIEKVSYSSLNLSKLKSVDVKNVNEKIYKMDEKKLEKGELDFSNYSGIEYINKLFFYRTSHILRAKKLRKILINTIIFIAIPVILYITRNEISKVDKIFLTDYMHIVLFLSCYFIFSGDFFIRYCFLNMDLSLMKNNFYRNEKLLMKSIKIRAIELIKYYFIPFILFIIMTIIVSYILGLNIILTLRNVLFATMGLIFFTFHYLFAYYIIQPFTVGMEVKNPLYTLLTYIIYMGGYFSITSGVESKILTVIFAAFFVIYITLGFIGVIKLAPKRFRIK